MRNVLSNVETLNLSGGFHGHSLADNRTTWRRRRELVAVAADADASRILGVPKQPQSVCCGGAHPGGFLSQSTRRVSNKAFRFGVDQISRRSSSHCSFTALLCLSFGVCVVNLCPASASDCFIWKKWATLFYFLHQKKWATLLKIKNLIFFLFYLQIFTILFLQLIFSPLFHILWLIARSNSFFSIPHYPLSVYRFTTTKSPTYATI